MESLIDLLDSKYSLSDLTTLLMKVFERKTQAMAPETLLKNYAANRYVAPSSVDPISLLRLELDCLQRGRNAGMIPLALSPVAPLGTCSAIASVSQNKIISAIRGTEIVSDPTNLMALLVAQGIRDKRFDNRNAPIHFCCTHRCTRVEAAFTPTMVPHFTLFTAVSAGRDTGSYTFEYNALAHHLRMYVDFFLERYNKPVRLVARKRGGYADVDGFFSRMTAHLEKTFPNAHLDVGETDLSNPYYAGINVKLFVDFAGELLEFGDMGFVNWTQRLLGSPKERFFISAVGLERLLLPASLSGRSPHGEPTAPPDCSSQEYSIR